jgi:SPP1 family predicted phage head-tail adaptor
MRAGQLDRRITIQDYAESRNAYGDVTDTWSTHLECWANFIQKKGEVTDADKNQNHSATLIFYTRYFSTITEDMRILFDSKYYKIEEIKELQRQEGLQIMVSLLNQT